MQKLTIHDFNYEIPESLIAQTPVDKRENSRLLVYRAPFEIAHKQFDEIVEMIPRDTLIVRNNSKVFSSRIHSKKESGATIEVFLLETPRDNKDGCTVECLARPMRKLSPGTLLKMPFGDAIVSSKNEGQTPTLTMQFNLTAKELIEHLDEFGEIPLPPYIKRQNTGEDGKAFDKKRYQTTYADDRLKGSVAASTSGLHFTPKIDQKLIQEKGVEFCSITLEIGGGTFLPVKVNEINQHEMHSEWYHVSKRSWDQIQKARLEKRKIIAVGTTTLRTLESFANVFANSAAKSEVFERYHSTDLFIYPKHRNDRYIPEIIDGLITNFHQPHSTLLMLISALIGLENAKNLYDLAIRENYRFFSYGDTSLLWLKDI